MYPSHVSVDRTLAPESAVRSTLESIDIPVFDGPERLDRLHRILYPVFQVTVSYRDDGFLHDETAEVRMLVDGLWSGNDPDLLQYREGCADPQRIDLGDYDLGTDHPGLGETVLLEHQAPDDSAAALLGERLADVRRRRDREAADGDAYLRTLRENFGLPDSLDPDSYVGIDEVDRVYLPFWLAQVRSERGDNRVLVTVRDGDDDPDPDAGTHGWLATFFDEDPTRLAEFSQTVQMRRTEDVPGETESEGQSQVTQPDGVDMNAESLVTPDPGRGFGDVGGMSDLKRRLRKTVLAPIQQPETYGEYGIDPVNGVLLYGPPGCGKTYLAGALAGELGRYFVEVSPADLTSKYMGEPAQKVADLFTIARANQPAILFVDELDALAGSRDGEMNASERQAVNQLLSELEDLGDDDVVVVGATNLLDDIDPAIRRSGRFDERVEVPPPDADARRAILRIHLAERPMADDLEFDVAVERTAGFAASDLELIAEETARRALEDGTDIETSHLVAAVEAVDSSISDWIGQYQVGDGRHVTQPDGVGLSARSLVTPDPSRDFDAVGGMEPLLRTLRQQVIEPVTEPERFEEYGIDPLRGLLLYGPPGCGKTYVTRALAGELDRFFIEVSPADLTSKYMGEPAQNVADLFEIARANQPCILFVDELDALAGRRDGDMNTSERQVVNQLLAELESVAEDDVVVVGATNLLEDLDPAIRRSGRFDERVEVPPPDADARRAILEVHLEDRPVAERIDWDPIVEATAGYAASDLALLLDHAARRALRADETVSTEHLETAVADTASSLDHWDDGERYAESEKTTNLRYLG